MPELQPPTFTVQDVQQPTLLVRLLRWITGSIIQLSNRVEALITTVRENDKTGNVVDIRNALQYGGQFPLNVQGLEGILANPQPAGAERLAAVPDGQLLQQYFDTQFLVVTNGTAYDLYTVIGGNPNSLVKLIAGAGPSNMMTLDTPQTVTSAGVKTVDASWIFEVDQFVTAAKNGVLLLQVQNTDSTHGNATATMRAFASTAIGQLSSYGSAFSSSAWGIALADYTSLNTYAGNGLIIGSINATPVIFGTNNLERAKIDSAGLMTFITPSKCILVKPSSAPAANTIMLELQTTGGSSLWSVDAEGDMVAHDATIHDLIQTNGSVAADSTGTSFDIDGLTGAAGTLIFRVLFGGSSKFSIDGAGNVGLNGDLTIGDDLDVTDDVHIGSDLTTDGNTLCGGETRTLATAGFRMGNVKWLSGSGSPESVITAVVGSLFSRTDGGAGTSLYIKESGSGNTGWRAV